jgi:MerR family transcriptional regulator, thiopeptide resistance regulator
MVRRASVDGALTVSALAKRFGLSRSTLLHYHRIQLCKPSGRSANGYRIYGAEAIARLVRIVQLREAGLSLRAIKRVLDAHTPLAEVLEEQIGVLNRRVAQARTQQRVVLSLLELSAKQPGRRTLSKQTWTQMFRAIGLSDEEMRAWHANFEKNMPDAHADFLHLLGLDAAEIERIRAWSLT